MTDHSHHNARFPKLPLYSGVALIAITLIMVVGVRITGKGDLRTPEASVVTERMLQFADRADGGISVTDARSHQLVEEVAPGSNGFLRGTLRGLARERKREGIGPELPFRLSERSDGHLLLQDPSTGRLIDLGSFGPTNAAVFARLLLEKPVSQPPQIATQAVMAAPSAAASDASAEPAHAQALVRQQ